MFVLVHAFTLRLRAHEIKLQIRPSFLGARNSKIGILGVLGVAL